MPNNKDLLRQYYPNLDWQVGDKKAIARITKELHIIVDFEAKHAALNYQGDEGEPIAIAQSFGNPAGIAGALATLSVQTGQIMFCLGQE